MKNSTKHMLAQRLIGLVAILIFLGATNIWPIPILNLLPDWVGLVSLFILLVVIVSGLGFGPWGRAVGKMIVEESKEYRDSLKPDQPWKVNDDG